MKIAPRRCILVLIILFYLISIASAEVSENFQYENNFNAPSDIRIVLDHIFISRDDGSLQVSEIVVFRNEGTETYYTTDDHTFFAVSTPTGIMDLRTDVMECCMIEQDGMVLMDPMQPIEPGDNFEMKISYKLPPGQENVFEKRALYNTTSLSVFVSKKGETSIESVSRTLTLHGEEFDVIAFVNLKTGDSVKIPLQMAERSGKVDTAAGLLFLFSAGIIYIFRRRIIRKGKREYTLEELEHEKIKIFQNMYSFEKHASSERSDEFERWMDEYKQKAIRIFIKIDKIKKGDQSGSLNRRKGIMKLVLGSFMTVPGFVILLII